MEPVKTSFFASIESNYENHLDSLGTNIYITHENADIASDIGIGVDVAGAVGIGAGAVLLFTPFTFIPGIIAIACGAVTLAGGSTVIHTAKVKKNRIRNIPPVENISWTPSFSDRVVVDRTRMVQSENLINESDDSFLSLESSEENVSILANQLFPIKPLSALFEFAEDIQLKNILDKALIGKEINIPQNGVLSKLAEQLLIKLEESDKTGLLKALLHSNFTYNKIFQIILEVLSDTSFQDFIGFAWSGFTSYFQGKSQLDTFLLLPKIKKLHEALSEINNHMEKFKIEEHKFNYEAICLSFLKDRSLMEFLQDTHIKVPLIATILAMAKIPNFDSVAAEIALRKLLEFQEFIVETQDNCNIAKYNDLMNLFINSENPKFEKLAEDVLKVAFKLKNIARIYLQPMLTSIHLLALPHIEKLIKERYTESHMGSKIENDCEILFDSYRNEQLGPFVKSPITNYIHQHKLDHYCFTSYAYKENDIEISFSELIFNNFSFKSTQFRSFKFKGNIFANCDFSDASFIGSISFSNVYIDKKTAQTFFRALETSIVNFDATFKRQKGIIVDEDTLYPEILLPYIRHLK